MIEKKIKISGVDDAKDIVSIAMKYNFSINIVNDDITVDAKSIMGIFSLDFGCETTLVMDCNNSSDAVKAFSKFFI